jgi:hypothetical protein
VLFLLGIVLVLEICLAISTPISEAVLVVRRQVQLNLGRTLSGDVGWEVSVISQVAKALRSTVLIVLMKAEVSVVEAMKMLQIVTVEEAAEVVVLELVREGYILEN